MGGLRDAMMAVALATGGVGCATFCDECDDFPAPGGPGGYSMMPGTYTGPPLQSAPEAGAARSAAPAQGSTPAQSSTPPPGGPPGTVPEGESAPTPPATRRPGRAG